MIEPAHHRLSIATQCRLLSIRRSSYYDAPVPESEETLALMRVIDAALFDMPWYGSRQMVRHLRRNGHDVGRRRVRRLMAKMGLSPIYQRPRTSDPHPQHRVYPYLLRIIGNRATQPCVVRRCDLYPDAAGVPLSSGDHGLSDPQSAGLAAVEHNGCRVPRRGIGGSADALRRQARDLQY
jgi:hypothetical protein